MQGIDQRVAVPHSAVQRGFGHIGLDRNRVKRNIPTPPSDQPLGSSQQRLTICDDTVARGPIALYTVRNGRSQCVELFYMLLASDHYSMCNLLFGIDILEWHTICLSACAGIIRFRN